MTAASDLSGAASFLWLSSIANRVIAPEAFGSVLTDWIGAEDTEQRWRSRLRDVPVNLVLNLDGEPVAMVSITGPDELGAVELISLWVAPVARGRGVGDEAVRRAITSATQRFPRCAMTLSVKTANVTRSSCTGGTDLST